MQNLPCPHLAPCLPLPVPETCRASKTFYTQAGGQGNEGVLAPKGACRQVKSVTENEPRVACKFDIEATPDMPKRIRQAGGRADYKVKSGERGRYVEKERARGQYEEGLPKAQPKCCTVFFTDFCPSLFSLLLFPTPSSLPPLPFPPL